MDPRQDAAYSGQVRRFHAELWRARRREGVSDQSLRTSLARLARSGYVDAEVAVMFGVSRERVRQWRLRLGLTKRNKQTRGPFARVWDNEQGRFRAMGPEELDLHTRSARHEEELVLRSRRAEDLRGRSLACLHRLIARGEGIPTRCELAAELRTTISLLTAAWREPADRAPHREAFRRLYAAAGVLDEGRHRARKLNNLAPSVVETIRRAYAQGARTMTEMAWDYGVSYGTIWRVVRQRPLHDEFGISPQLDAAPSHSEAAAQPSHWGAIENSGRGVLQQA